MQKKRLPCVLSNNRAAGEFEKISGRMAQLFNQANDVTFVMTLSHDHQTFGIPDIAVLHCQYVSGRLQ